ncbi:MAG: sulfur reduction protein DsrE [Planctomycetes bacterium]|nr:sulfur reduction protein DsrE [Planctomycetota bacterium]
MAGYLLIESRDPFECNAVSYYCDLARDLAGAGNQVTVMLVQNAVLAARAQARAPGVTALTAAGVRVLADDFSLAERGIKQLRDGVESAPTDVVSDHLESGHKTLWH